MPRRGAAAEAFAERWLLARGLELLERNFHTRWGEIDLVMADGDTVVFVEVRHRRSAGHGSPAATVDGAKQQRLVRAAALFLAARPTLSQRPCRFDVLARTGPENASQVRWIRQAFTV